jgi:hypothetical protein
LDITVPTGPVSLGSGAPGATISGQFPATPLVTVTDDRATSLAPDNTRRRADRDRHRLDHRAGQARTAGGALTEEHRGADVHPVVSD